MARRANVLAARADAARTPRRRRHLARGLNDKSCIVRTFSMQALADIAAQDAALRPSIIKQLEKLARTGTPAMQARGHKLLAKLKAK